MNRFSLKIIFALFFMIVFWASAYVGIRAGLKGYSPGALALFRYLIASAVMFLIYLKLLRFRKIPLRDILYIIILGIFGFAIYAVSLNYGEITVTAGAASFLLSQIPVLIILYAVTFQNEKILWIGWLGTLISVIGIFLITIGEKEGMHFDVGIIYIFIAVLSGSIYAVMQKSLLTRIHPIEFTAYAIWGGTAALLIYLPQLISEIPKASFPATLAIIYIGIFPAAIAYLLWSYILSEMSISQAASYLYLIPGVTVIIGWVWLKEIPSWLAIFGGLLTLLGAHLVNRSAQRTAAKNTTSNKIKSSTV